MLAAPKRWLYSFATSDGRALEALSVALVRDGYEIVTLEDRAMPTLTVARDELHSPSTLLERNAELGKRARTHGARYVGAALAD